MERIIKYICIELDKQNVRVYDNNILYVIRELSIFDVKQFDLTGKIAGVEYIIKKRHENYIT